MVQENSLEKGLRRVETFKVTREHAADHVGSGGSPVLATPWMIAFMEGVAFSLLQERLPNGRSNVGVFIKVKHLAPTPIGASVRVLAEIESIDGSQVTFNVHAWDEVEKIGEGNHKRVIIDEERFLRGVKRKGEAFPGQ